jgi:L-histidine N-alpha-methyltransferase
VSAPAAAGSPAEEDGAGPTSASVGAVSTVIAPTVEVHLSADDLRRALEHDVRKGLTSAPKELPPVYFYDERGSRLFDEITRLPEYYPTRSERSILDAHAKEMVLHAEADVLVEIGAGTCEKSRVLLDAMQTTGQLSRFVPLDVSETTLREAADALAEEYPGLVVTAVVGDFHRHLDRLPVPGRRLFAFLGGTIGNLDPEQRSVFLRDVAAVMGKDDRFLLGTDLVKDRGRLVSAYDDAAGVTAEFNRNVLHVLNRELGADFDPSGFAHEARWNESDQRIEMWLRSECDQRIRVTDLGLELAFAEGEGMRTEISVKFSPSSLEEELNRAGFAVEAMWTAAGDEFLLTLARPV